MPSPALAPVWVALLGGSAPPPEPPPAAPTGPAASSLSWNAPSGCPDRAAIVARLEGLLGAPLTAARAVVVAAEAEIVTDEPARRGYVLRLEVRSDSGVRRREIAGGDCEELSQVAALLVAIAIDPGVAQAHVPAPEPEPEPQPESDQPPQPEPSPKRDTDPEPAPPRELSGAVRFGGGLTLGPLPSLAGLVHLSVALRWRWLRAEAGFSHRLARPIETNQGAGASADIWATAGEAAVCGVPKVPRVEFPLCIGGEVGAVTGRSRDVAAPGFGGGLWGAARVGGGLIALPIPRVGVVVDADLVVPVSRPGFHVAGVGVLHRAAPVGLDAVIALEVRFP